MTNEFREGGANEFDKARQTIKTIQIPIWWSWYSRCSRIFYERVMWLWEVSVRPFFALRVNARVWWSGIFSLSCSRLMENFVLFFIENVIVMAIATCTLSRLSWSLWSRTTTLSAAGSTKRLWNIPQNRERIYCWFGYHGHDLFEFCEETGLIQYLQDVISTCDKPDEVYYYREGKHLRSASRSRRVTAYQWRRQYVQKIKNGVVPTPNSKLWEQVTTFHWFWQTAARSVLTPKKL